MGSYWNLCCAFYSEIYKQLQAELFAQKSNNKDFQSQFHSYAR